MRLSPLSQRDLVVRLRRLGWTGPKYRSDHPFMLKQGHPPLKIPNPHAEDISVDLLKKILSQAGISRREWLAAR
ncbi:MAG: type II toxin-antitoxin system HicA family toxin [Pyrinomonadaceae bacterium]|nr:type II toxin-antitoxin system HicA family toxin [Pyrinomonadaceae bacterium]MBA3569066.1 type II toxin-antitoxin system HicA family toxin [Pyrinomonadaceae bacterium]